MTAGALKAEQQVSMKAYGHAWSPKLAEAGRRVTFWRKFLQMVKVRKGPGKMLIPTGQITSVGKLWPGLNIKYYQARLEDAWASLHFIQQKATVTWQL